MESKQFDCCAVKKGRYAGIMRPKCLGGVGCDACWDKYNRSNRVRSLQAAALITLVAFFVSCSTPRVGITSTPASPGIHAIARIESGDGGAKQDAFRVLGDPITGDVACPISTLRAGECAPYDGTLLSACATARIIAELESVDAKVAAEVKMTEDIERAKCALEAAKAAADRKAEKTVSDKQIAARDAQIKAMNKQLASQQSPMFWMGLGVAGGATVTVLAVLAVSAASK